MIKRRQPNVYDNSGRRRRIFLVRKLKLKKNKEVLADCSIEIKTINHQLRVYKESVIKRIERKKGDKNKSES